MADNNRRSVAPPTDVQARCDPAVTEFPMGENGFWVAFRMGCYGYTDRESRSELAYVGQSLRRLTSRPVAIQP